MPIMASAGSWFFNTQARNAGGTIDSPNKTQQRVADGSIFRSYTTQGGLKVTVTADPGYTIRNVTVNSVEQGPQGGRFETTVQGMSDQSVLATFVADGVQVTAKNDGGTVSPASLGSLTYGYQLPAPVTFRFLPASGYEITGIRNLPVDPKVSHSPFSPGVNKPVTVTFDTGYVFTSDTNLIAEYVNNVPTLNPILVRTVLPGANVGLSAVVKNLSNPSYSWEYVSGPANVSSVQVVNGKVYTSVAPGPALTLANPNAATASFTAPALSGQYKFRLTVSSDGSPDLVGMAAVNIVASSYTAVKNQCQFCHSANRIGDPKLFSNWSASAHRVNGITCDKCHAGVATGGHPGTVDGNVCRNCHLGADGNVTNHPFSIGSAICTTCHNPHSTAGSMASAPAVHYNNATSAGYPASYVTSRSTCLDCHVDSSQNAAIRQQWKNSGHAATTDAPWTAYDFKTRSGCVQCHTATGFIAYSTGKVTAAWGSASDKTKEVLRCTTCHSDIANGVTRKVTPVKPFADDDYRNRDFSTSNICADCHSGRNNGNSIQVKVGNADFGNLAFIAPHYLAAGATLQGKAGYHFPGATYAFYSSNSHRGIGMFNNHGTGTVGPCVACHMTSDAPHSYKAAATDANGAVTAVASSACANCHGSSLDVTALAADQAGYDNALTVLKAMLADKGLNYSSDYPYFGTTNWGSGQAGANAMGAAYNYKLLLAEPGAYAHNGAYARKLITDSIDVLYNGSVTGSIDGAVAYLQGKGAITKDAADALNAYRTANSCATCHANNTLSHPAHLSASIGCAQCHAGTAASNASLLSGTQLHLNGQKDVVLAAGGSYAGGTCSSVYCHSNGKGAYSSPAWGSASTKCGFCHPVASLRGAHAAHVGSATPASYGDTADNSTAAEYRFGCGSCHTTDLASHLDGSIEVTLIPTADGSLRSKNDPSLVTSGIGNSGSGISGTPGASVFCSAAYCHSNGRSGAALSYATSPDWYNAAAYTGDRCAMCHGNAPATGAHARHAVSIHNGLVSDSDGMLIQDHGDPAQSTTISCDICHSATVVSDANDNNNSCATCHAGNPKGAPALDKRYHVTGSVAVVLKDVRVKSKAQVAPSRFASYSGVWSRTSYKQGSGSYDTAKLSLAQGVWDGSAKSCGNIACHNAGPAAPAANWNSTLSCVDCHSKL